MTVCWDITVLSNTSSVSIKTSAKRKNSLVDSCTWLRHDQPKQFYIQLDELTVRDAPILYCNQFHFPVTFSFMLMRNPAWKQERCWTQSVRTEDSSWIISYLQDDECNVSNASLLAKALEAALICLRAQMIKYKNEYAECSVHVLHQV